MPRKILGLIWSLIISLSGLSQIYHTEEECTVGVASGRVRQDGRPLLWKTRDYRSDYNTVFYTTSAKYSFISNITPQYGMNKSWMGVNEKGFAIINSLSSDLKKENTGMGNGEFMNFALANCATVSDFNKLLDSTNITGRQTNANFGVIDSTGAAVIFETDGKKYWKYDAENQAQSPEGYVLRTNFSLAGGGKGGMQRFNRTKKIVKSFAEGDSLNYKSILRHQMRDLVDKDNNPVTIPWDGQWVQAPIGYINSSNSICRPSSISAVVIHGVKESELARFSTMWTIQGQPATSIAIPFWPVGKPPELISHLEPSKFSIITNDLRSLLFNYKNPNYINTNLLRSSDKNGLWNYSFRIEDNIISSTKSMLNNWRDEGVSDNKILNAQKRFTRKAYRSLKKAYKNLK